MMFGKPPSLCAGTRREFLWQSGAGFAGVALAALLEGDGFFARAAQVTVAPKLPARRSKVKSCIFPFHVWRAIADGSVRLQASPAKG
jgi:hypothetical protein